MYGRPENLRLLFSWSFFQHSKPAVELLAALLDRGFLQPGVDRLAFELDENPLAAVLDRRQPGRSRGLRVPD